MWHNSDLLNRIATYLWMLNLLLMLGVSYGVVAHLANFDLREVRVSGDLQHVSREQIYLVLSQYPRISLLTLNLARFRLALSKLPWARTIEVRKQPSKGVLEVLIEEHQVLARWGDVGLVNNHGEVFYAASDAVLPIFYGQGSAVAEMTEHYEKLSHILQPAGLNIAELHLNARHSWHLLTNSSMLIVLGRFDIVARLKKFITAYSVNLSGLKNKIRYVDLRYPNGNGFAVRKPIPIEDSKDHSRKLS